MIIKRQVFTLFGLVMGAMLFPSAAHAQDFGQADRVFVLLGHTALFGVLGLVLLIGSYFIWDLITPFKLRQELVGKHNTSVAIVTAGIIIGTAIVIAAGLLVVS